MPNEEANPSTEQHSTSKHPWRDKEILQSMYCEQELSLREVGDCLNCDKSTVRRWLDRHGIETRLADDQKTGPCYHINDDGYGYFLVHHDGESFRAGEHELIAIHGGADSRDVFSDDTDCHHHIRIPSPLDPPRHIEIPGNVEVLDRSEHRSSHALGTFDTPEVGEILSEEDQNKPR